MIRYINERLPVMVANGFDAFVKPVAVTTSCRYLSTR